MTSITFSGRIPAPQMCFVGMKGEHNAEVIAFAGLPALGEGQTEILNLMLPDGTADAIEIIDGQITLTRDHTPQPGTLIAWAEIHVGTEIVWKSEKIRLIIDTLPDADGEIEKQYPTAFEQAIAQTGANVEAAEAAQGKAEDAQEAAETAQGKAEDAQDAAEAARDQVLGMSATAETLPEGSEATVHYEGGVMAFGIPKGDTGAEGRQGEPGRDGAPGKDGQDGAPGQDGVSPVISVSEITGGHRVTATDAQGDHIFDVMDGDPGDPTELIDDTAGAGDTDKVWSADKSAGVRGDLLSAISGIEGSIAPVEASATATAAHAVGELFVLNNTLLVAMSAIAVGDTITTEGNSPNAAVTKLSEKLIKDVQVNGTSVVTDGVAEVPMATPYVPGVVIINGYGLTMDNQGVVRIVKASSSYIKAGTHESRAIVPYNQHESTFYGLAKSAGDSTQSTSSNAVGQYTDAAKSAIHTMLSAPVTVSGTTPTITALDGIRYICGEVATLDLTPPASGDCEVIFTSGSTPTVLTVPSTVKWPVWFDATALEADKVYDIIITNGVYGMVASWDA